MDLSSLCDEQPREVKKRKRGRRKPLAPLRGEVKMPRRAPVMAIHPDNTLILSANDVARFWSRVKIRGDNECWEYRGTTNRGSLGYGAFWVGNEQFKGTQAAHKVALVATGVYVPPCAPILHSCDNPKCSNPLHLKPGTQAENVRDCIEKGRFKSYGRPLIPKEKNGTDAL